MTQCQRIYKALKSGRKLTALDIHRISGSLCASRRMFELMKSNRRIVRGWRKLDGRKYRCWSLA